MDKQVIVQVKPNKAFFKQFAPQQFALKNGGDINKDEDYNHIGAFKQDVFLGTSKRLSPSYDLNQNKWNFRGEIVDLKKLVVECALRHEKGVRAGQIIQPDEVDMYNRSDPFFDHSEMYVDLQNGKAKLNLGLAKDRFMYLCLSADPDVTNSKVTNPYMAGDQKFELIDIQEEKAKDADGLDDRIEAYVLFKKMKNNYDYLIAVSRALGILRDDRKPEDPTALSLEIEKRFVNNVSPYPNSNKSFQRVFIETAEKDTETLNRMWLVHFGIYKSVLRPKTTGSWTLKLKDGSIIELPGVKGNLSAYEYFADENNFAHLEALMHQTNAFSTAG